ncbi:MAG TPA: hypothetical protein VHU19_02070 [Pyrinomonadaceae bacterium]|jgi:hypothetical protein|nr:hypothetical protein [Pyrinomonadaceae bacterium]
MKKSKKTDQGRSAAKRLRVFRVGVFASVLLAVGVVSAIARYETRSVEPSRPTQGDASAQPAAPPANRFVTVEVGGKRLRVNAQTLQQGPLTQAQSQQIADALQGNKSTDGLVEVQHADGAVSVDLQNRFQNVMMARKNDDGSVSTACVDTPEAATSFFQNRQTTSSPGTTRKAASKE